MIFALQTIRISPYMWQECDQLRNQPEFRDTVSWQNKQWPNSTLFFKVYLRLGFQSIIGMSNGLEESRYVLLYMVIYCASQITIQRLIQKIMIMSSPRQRTVSYIFGSMVFITAAAFAAAGWALLKTWDQLINNK